MRNVRSVYSINIGKVRFTVPLEEVDPVDVFMFGISEGGTIQGMFLFPVNVLSEKGYVTSKRKAGKVNIELLPPMVQPKTAKVRATQSWQTSFYVSVQGDVSTAVEKTRQILGGLGQTG